MVEEVSEVKLYGTWNSSYSKRVELALKLKGIPYEFIEENLQNKSAELLQYNPVHKKIPVLVHNGKPIAESLVILEYIDETWKDAPLLLPVDPYERAKARFWANFYDQKFHPSTITILMCEGEKQEKAIKEVSENLGVIEEGLCRDFPMRSSTTFFGGDTPGYIDIILSGSCSYRAFEEAIGTNQIVDPQEHSLFLSWLDALREHPVVKETLAPHDKLVAAVKVWREKLKNMA